MLEQSGSEIPSSSIPRSKTAPGGQTFYADDGTVLNVGMQLPLVTDSMLTPLERSAEMMDLTREVDVRQNYPYQNSVIVRH